MSLKYLGKQIDIHGGGEDLIFPHHENEIAQTEAFTGAVPFVSYWLHNAWVKMGEEKMSKSLGNFITIRDGLEKVGGDGLRLWILTSHYRKPLTFSEDTLDAAKTGADRLRTAARGAIAEAADSTDVAAYRERFTAAMDDDLNTPQALAVLFDLAKEVNRARDEHRGTAEGQALLLELAGVLGLRLENKVDGIDPVRTAELATTFAEELEAAGLADEGTRVRTAIDANNANATPLIDLLVQIRTELRTAKQWQLADGARACLAEAQVVLEDTPQGTIWKPA